MRIAIVLPNLEAGGVERVSLLLAEEFVRAGHEPMFLLRQRRGVLLGEVPADIPVHSLDVKRVRGLLPPFIRWLRRERPDALLVALWPLTGLAGLAVRLSGVPARVVVSERNNFRLMPALSGKERLLLRYFGRQIYGWTDEVVGVSSGVAESLRDVAGLDPDKITVIHNPIRPRGSEAFGGRDEELVAWWKQVDACLLAIGTLKLQKGFDILIDAVAELRSRGKSVRLVILGEGPLREALQARIVAKDLQDHIRLPGFRADPFPFLRAAHLFVLSSRWEGLGNVITEALACGTPVVSADCESGPSEILEKGRYGALVPVGDHLALADGVALALEKPADPEHLRRRALDFSPEAAAAKYLRLLER